MESEPFATITTISRPGSGLGSARARYQGIAVIYTLRPTIIHRMLGQLLGQPLDEKLSKLDERQLLAC
jgi:hypothetical protein